MYTVCTTYDDVLRTHTYPTQRLRLDVGQASGADAVFGASPTVLYILPYNVPFCCNSLAQPSVRYLYLFYSDRAICGPLTLPSQAGRKHTLNLGLSYGLTGRWPLKRRGGIASFFGADGDLAGFGSSDDSLDLCQ